MEHSLAEMLPDARSVEQHPGESALFTVEEMNQMPDLPTDNEPFCFL